MIKLPKSMIEGSTEEAPKVLTSGSLVEGPATEETENLMARICDREHAILVNSNFIRKKNGKVIRLPG